MAACCRLALQPDPQERVVVRRAHELGVVRARLVERARDLGEVLRHGLARAVQTRPVEGAGRADAVEEEVICAHAEGHVGDLAGVLGHGLEGGVQLGLGVRVVALSALDQRLGGLSGAAEAYVLQSGVALYELRVEVVGVGDVGGR